ncbi:aldo/keto reductase [Avibacterium paragallinarum]|uniref:aldo/keto reductase n=1 Tax=Avibacterium paragallinarum TaxID=728 RepID=UPI00021AD5BB|nr:aldo/keto reductase [Avibacterium paragallinarum]AZI13707.1 aldo/keto reductase [Avibacterium paragallinarum]QIR11977.1 aldo/keto reductase [Avibacterium paragallinarum]QJE09203.1 aldo/keto reductase [Avibacterium paragallinarum]QJE11399.1 aldo/keto reductase [Avibacterium paragallinarum]QJE13597.1 aldo/keto reductase [Avibacterium paragallinarum]
MKTATLNNGIEIPMIGFGVYQVSDEETEQVVLSALEQGYRLLDTAAIYGNEAGVGRAIKASGIPREEIFVTTKLWIQRQDAFNGTQKALDESLRRLGLDYVDLYLMHQPLGDVHEEWRAMEIALKAGKTRAIGVSNFHMDRLADLITCHDTVPAVNQIETHPFYQREAELAFHKELGILQQSWGPLAEGKFDIFHNPVLSEIAAKHGKSVAQVVLRWLNQRGIAIIPKSVKVERMRENRDILDSTLDAQDLAAIATLNRDEIIFDHRDPKMVQWLAQARG